MNERLFLGGGSELCSELKRGKTVEKKPDKKLFKEN